MAAITTRPTNKLIKQCKSDFSYTFLQGNIFKWSSKKQYIMHPRISSWEDFWTLLHEIAHAELDHFDFCFDVELLDIETKAWVYAVEVLAPRYKTTISQDFIEDNLDTYREWVHQRSTCPNCRQNGIQPKTGTYQCINCKCLWSAKSGITCVLAET